jgi:nucleotide-binding universal stress UspA family protein
MAKRILVPIDVHEGSEAIVPVVAPLARHSGAAIRLVRVSPVPERVVGDYGRTIAYADQEMARLTAEGLDDLHRVESELHGIPVDSVVRFGDPVEEILVEAEAFEADLIALVSSRRGALRNALSPGVAQRLIRKAAVPTLALHERGSAGPAS